MTARSDIDHAMTVFSPAKPTSATAPASAPASPAREAAGHTLRASAASARSVKGNGEARSLPRYWPTWTMLTVFIFIGFECILLAAALKGSWLILLAPGLVCSIKAWDMWKQLKRAVED